MNSRKMDQKDNNEVVFKYNFEKGIGKNVKKINDWVKLINFYRNEFPPNEQWIFRGHSNASWKLQSTLERALEFYDKPLSNAPSIEIHIINEFLRKANNYQIDFRSLDALECLSYIQHFGGPTRLLDWTYSFYIAAFFALSSAKPNSEVVIWCFRSVIWEDFHSKYDFFSEKGKKIMRADPTFRGYRVQGLFGIPQILDDGRIKPQKTNAKPCVYQLSSQFMNPRIERQQGVYLVQTDLTRSFEDNVEAMISNKYFRGAIRKIVIQCNEDFLREALIDLRRMSITYENLFDDITYFCKSLALGILDKYTLLTDISGNNPYP